MDRYRVIEKFAKNNAWTQGLELGVWVGVTTFWLMKNTSVNMTCVDAWEVQDDNPDYDWQYNKKPVFKDGKLIELQEFKLSTILFTTFFFTCEECFIARNIDRFILNLFLNLIINLLYLDKLLLMAYQ